MKKTSFLIIVGFLAIVLLSLFAPKYFLPSSILNYLPSFSIDNWERPKNSLLADPVFQFEPWRNYAKEKLLNGEFPLWNDKNGNGSPFFANPQTAVLYPLNFLYYIFPLETSLLLIPLLKLYFFGIFSYIYFLSLKISRKISLAGAFVATFSAFPVVWLLWPHTNVFIFLPLTLFLIEKIKGSRNYKWYFLLSSTYLIAILGGHPETLFHILCINLFYILVRFWNQKNKIIKIVLSICLGFLFGSIQILPFLEYLKNSYVLDHRLIENVKHISLPVGSFVLNFIPFLLGAPHLQFYKPFSMQTNFQETIGGYTGPIIFILAVVGFFLYRKENIIKIWANIIIFIWLFTYGIWPVSLIGNLPLINISSNLRLIGIVGFGLVTIALITLDKLFPKKISSNSYKKLILISTTVSILILFLSIIMLAIFKIGKTIAMQEFLSFLQYHIFYIFTTTILFFLIFIYIQQKRLFNFRGIIILAIPIFLQTIVLFWNYNPTTPKANYYPEDEFIKTLKNLPKGPILEVGNLLFPANVNLVYGLNSIDNNDAIEVKNYRNTLDSYFPYKNQWKVVDQVDLENISKFGVRYIISDYDINLKQDSIQGKYDKILPPFASKNPIKISFEAKYNNIKQIRLLTANFNRKNTCLLNIEIFDSSTNSILSKSLIDCKNIRDFMYYSVDTKAQLIKGNKYIINISSNTSDPNNNITLWGNIEGIPFMQTYYEDQDLKQNYKLIWNKKSIYIWEVPGFSNFVTKGKYEVIYEEPEHIALNINMENNGLLETYKTYYPGWVAKIDGKEKQLNPSGPFISLNISKGNHLVEFAYKPLSFYLGFGITVISFVVSLVFLIRQNIRNFLLVKLKNLKIKWWEHGLIYLTSFIIATSAYIFLIKLIPFTFKTPFTTAINWNTVHNYPKQQDYLYFFSGISFITLLSIFIWLFFIWVKLRKKA